MCLFAHGGSAPPWWVWIIVLVVVVSLGALVLFIFRSYEAHARRALQQVYTEFQLSTAPRSGDVAVVFHTYHGLVAWFTQTEHRVFVSGVDAKRLLNRFARFNLTWGLFTWGAIFVPVLTLFNYFAQRRSVSRQITIKTT
jgi:hypothetical protein